MAFKLIQRVKRRKRRIYLTTQADQMASQQRVSSDSLLRVAQGVVNEGKALARRIQEGPLAALLDKTREEQIQEISLGQVALSEEEEEANQQFLQASVSLGASVVFMLVYPPLMLLHIVPMIFLSIPFFKKAYTDLFVRRKVTRDVSSSLFLLVSVGYLPFNYSIALIGTMGVWLFSLTNKLVVKTKDTTRKDLTNLFGRQPRSVWALHEGVEIEVPYESIALGDIVVVDTGQMVPFDGIVQNGIATIDQHMLTGEAQPVEKEAGDLVLAATIVLSGKIYVQVEKAGSESVAAQIGEILAKSSDFTSSVQLRGIEIADQTALPTMLFSAAALPFIGPSGALAVLVSGIGENMELLGPISVLNYLQVMSKHGILIKDGRALEQVSKIDTVVFDKTGTLTLEQPHVGAIHTCNGLAEDDLLLYAAAAEQRHTHPIARAILQEAEARGLLIPTVSDAAYEVGYGVKVTHDGEVIRVGSNRFMDMEEICVPQEIAAVGERAQAQGYSMIYLALGDRLAGAIELHPTLRPEAKQVVERLRQRELDLYLISGDHSRPTQLLAKELGIDHYFAETLPENKAQIIEELQGKGKAVCFVGDGINDAIALQRANLSVSIRGATTVATDTAQVILMNQSLTQLDELFLIAEQFESNMQVNLISTVVPGVVIIGGAFLGPVRYLQAALLYFLGTGVGVANAMLPMFNGEPDAQESPVQE